MCAKGLSHLDLHAARARNPSLDQDFVASLDLADISDGIHRRAKDDRQRRCLFGRQAGVVLQKESRGHLHVLGVRAPSAESRQGEARRARHRAHIEVGFLLRKTGRRDDALADLEPRDTLSQFGHLARGVGTQDVREWDLLRDRTLTDVVIESVHARCQDLNQDMAELRTRTIHALIPEHVKIAKLVEHDGLHLGEFRPRAGH